MKCPFCGNEMKNGVMRAPMQTAPKWYTSGERTLFGGKPLRGFKHMPPAFEAEGYLCERCGKLILDAKI